MIVKLANGTSYEVCATGEKATAVTPSSNPKYRCRMDIYLHADTMSTEDFIVIFSNEENLKEINLSDDSFETLYKNYTIVTSIGKELAETVNSETGEVLKEYRLAAHLEQPTFTEQQLQALGINI